MIDTVVLALSWLFIVTGSVFAVIGAVGVVRFPEFWSRLHAASVSDSAGVILLIVGMCLQAGATLVTVKLLIIGVFLFITGPTATHAIANAALVTGMRPPEGDGLTGEEPETSSVGSAGDEHG
ncbi:MAG: monovalent cation/H(+) antiporter subunit G [Paracoccaceae bacterium]